MRELALEAIQGRLTIKPTWVSVAGEVCTPPVREAVRSAWGIETSEFWGCSEGPMPFHAALEKACTSPTIWSFSSRRMPMATSSPMGNLRNGCC